MKKYYWLRMFSVGFLVISSQNAFAVEQTICFSKSKIGDSQYWQGSLGDNVLLYSGKCGGKKLSDMNKKGWRLIQVIGGLDSAFGMILEKK